MLAAVGFFDRDLWYLGGSGQNEVRMLDPVLAPVRRANHEWMKRDSVQKFTDTGFHPYLNMPNQLEPQAESNSN